MYAIFTEIIITVSVNLYFTIKKHVLLKRNGAMPLA